MVTFYIELFELYKLEDKLLLDSFNDILVVAFEILD